ncbi:MAG: FAD binding domain-containing protein [Actinomycetota bacterium]|nr:FAD binding domain-containing protein [Actinomycetota bacterium]
MKPARFDFHRARSVKDALILLDDLGEDAKAIAGGQSLMAMMNFRLARPSALVDLGGIDGLAYLRRDADGLRIGALTTHHQVERAGSELDGYDVVRRSMRWIGHFPIRTRGTIGGSLAHSDSTAEWCLLAVLLDAVVVAQSLAGRREILASDFLLGLYTTALAPGELVVEVRFPRPAPHAALVEYAERAGDFAIVAAAVRLDVTADVVDGGRLVLGGIGAVPLTVPVQEFAAGRPADEHLEAACAAAADRAVREHAAKVGDLGDPDVEYRAALAGSLARRALAQATQEEVRAR